MVRSLGQYSNIQVSRSAKYLGVYLGPGAPRDQWQGVIAKMNSRVQDIRVQGYSLATRVYMFNVYITRLFMFVGRFVNLTVEARKAYDIAVQGIVRAPWQSFPTELMRNLTASGMPGEIRDIGRELNVAQCRAAVVSGVLRDVRRRIEDRAYSDETLLLCAKPWHAQAPVAVAAAAMAAMTSDAHTATLIAERDFRDGG